MSDARAMPLPDVIEGYGPVRPYTGAFDNLGAVSKASVRVSSATPGRSKVLPDIRSAIQACGIQDGAVISSHHHLRNGDHVLNSVVDEIARLGLRDITVAASSRFPVHAPLAKHMTRGTVTGLHTAYMVGPVARKAADFDR